MRRYITLIVTLAAVLALGASPATAETYLTWDGSRGSANALTGTLLGDESGAVWLTRSLDPGVYTFSTYFASTQAHLSGGARLCIEVVGIHAALHCMNLNTGAGVGPLGLSQVTVPAGPRTVEISLTPAASTGRASVQLAALSIVRTG